MIIYYNCTIGSILLHSFLLICHPYPSSFHEMIFILVYIVHVSDRKMFLACGTVCMCTAATLAYWQHTVMDHRRRCGQFLNEPGLFKQDIRIFVQRELFSDSLYGIVSQREEGNLSFPEEE